VTETRYLGGLEYDLAGQIGRVHAIAYYDAMPWFTTVCGLPIQAYPPTGAEWVTVRAALRCGRCADALGISNSTNAR